MTQILIVNFTDGTSLSVCKVDIKEKDRMELTTFDGGISNIKASTVAGIVYNQEEEYVGA